MSFMFRGSFHRCDKKSEFCCTFCFFGHCGYPQHSQQSRLPRSSSSASGPPAQDLLGPPVQDTSTASNTQIKRRDAQGKSGSYPVVSLVTRSEKSSRRVEETLNPDRDICPRPPHYSTLLHQHRQRLAMALKISRIQRLSAVIGISFCFFLAEISSTYFCVLLTARLHSGLH